MVTLLRLLNGFYISFIDLVILLGYLQIANNPCTSLLEAHFRLEGHPHINPFRQVIHGAQHTYLFFEPSQVSIVEEEGW